MKFFSKSRRKTIQHKDIAAIFDHHYYVQRCNENIAPSSALEHFMDVGNDKLISPSPLFDPIWYREIAGQNAESSLSLLEHYYLNHGHYDPHPLFDSARFRASVKSVKENPLVDYILSTKAKEDRRKLISVSPFFSAEYYARQNADIVDAKIDPLVHYLTYGWREQRSPSPYFDTKWYLTRYADVMAANVEPLQHYLTTGIRERRQPHHLIDLDYYLYGAPDVRAEKVDPYRHFIEYGDREGRSPHPLFNPAYYRAARPGIVGERPFAHYVEHGVRDLSSPCPAFDARYYTWHYPLEADDPLRSFILAPTGERPHYHPLIDGHYQRVTSRNCALGANALTDYIQFRSHFAGENLARGVTTIPRPSQTTANRKARIAEIPSFPETKFSIVVPCYKSNLVYLEACVTSILNQTHKNWELILIDDGSPDVSTWKALGQYRDRDARIRTLKLSKNCGISAATNAGVAQAKGDYLVFVDHDDAITPDALSEMLIALRDQDADAAYSDQAFIDTNNVIEPPNLKPDWSPTLFAGVMYVGHLLVVKTAVARQAGLFKSEFDGCQDFEFMLRVGECTKKIVHVPSVLYYWRRSEGSVASDSNAKGKIEFKQARAVQEHFDRIAFPGRAVPDDRVPHRLRLYPQRNHESLPMDAIIQGPLTTSMAEVRSKLKRAGANLRHVSIVDWKHTPAEGCSAGSAPWVLFLDPSVELVDPHWLMHRLMHASQADAGFVDSHTYRPDGTIRSAGLVTTPTHGPRESYEGFRDGQDGTWGTLFCDREVSALGGTCTLVARERLTAIGGLSASYFSCEGAVRDASYRATRAGLRNISIAVRQVEMKPSEDRRKLSSEIDRQIFLDIHRSTIEARDPYYNINFVRDSTNFR